MSKLSLFAVRRGEKNEKLGVCLGNIDSAGFDAGGLDGPDQPGGCANFTAFGP